MSADLEQEMYNVTAPSRTELNNGHDSQRIARDYLNRIGVTGSAQRAFPLKEAIPHQDSNAPEHEIEVADALYRSTTRRLIQRKGWEYALDKDGNITNSGYDAGSTAAKYLRRKLGRDATAPGLKPWLRLRASIRRTLDEIKGSPPISLDVKTAL